MESLLSLIIIIAFIITFSYLGPFSDSNSKNLQQASISQTQNDIPINQITPPAPKPKQPVVLIDTRITSGPKEGEIIEETNKVVFEFEAQIYSGQIKGKMLFETKIEGFDEDWKKTSSKKRIVTLPSGPKEYTFLVRGKINDFVDPTPAKITFKINLSPYFKKVRIATVKTETFSSPSLITLSTNLKKEEEINISGWHIKGRTNSFVIPPGIEKYYPGYGPVPEESIFVKQGDIIYMSASSNPLGKNRNFRPNKCLGYLANYHDFIIPLPKKCPKPTREEISHLNPCCQEFILRLNTCQIPDYSNNIRISLDSECVSYLDKNFNYGGCFYQYSRDKDFLGKNWHIYLNRNIVVSNDCDTLYLRDQNGLFIDKYSYGRAVCQ